MKNKWIKYMALSLVLTGASTSVFAQFPERPSMEEMRKEQEKRQEKATKTLKKKMKKILKGNQYVQ